MSERLTSNSPEQVTSPEALERQRENLEKLQEAGKQAERDHAEVNVEQLQASVESQAISSKEVTVGENKENTNQQHVHGSQKEIKAEAYKRLLSKTRQQLKAPDRVMSRVIHQPAVEAVSNVVGKTVARPSGFLGGSLFALLGSAWLLYAAKHIGFTYNYLVMILLLAAGYVAGVIVELLIRAVARLKS